MTGSEDIRRRFVAHATAARARARWDEEERLSAVCDDTITSQVPALREALARLEHGRVPASG